MGEFYVVTGGSISVLNPRGQKVRIKQWENILKLCPFQDHYIISGERSVKTVEKTT